MIKLLQFKSLVLLLLFSPLFSFSQKLDHPLGEILFQLKNDVAIESFTNSVEESSRNYLPFSDIEVVSKPFNVWKINFDANEIDELSLLKEVAEHPLINNAQFNYFTENRTEPDDPYFYDLWHFKNIGQSGGTPGADLRATVAWGTTTGGLSYFGDTVVICVIDERFDLTHEDLAANIWVNHAEVPDNEIDDDGNGYIDDYFGWNINSGNDNIGNIGASDWHGTAVAGIAGAVGNNETGISGVCWNIKLMLVSRGNTTADVVAGYTYPFENRKKYNETQGQEGAFVVATNTSWGVDYGSPTDAPLWCAVYDSLGSVGILSAAATNNLEENVDIVGDLPTTCSSDFLITTTSVDHNDVKVSNAGYGAEHIDLGAFGHEVQSTLNNDTYGLVSGTSIAAPQITGAIGLLHTAPCPGFANLAINNPAQAALQLKEYILNGVDPNPSLENITVSGGRLNLYNSLSLLMDECDDSGCYGPYEVAVNMIAVTSAEVEWTTDASNSSINLRYKKTSGTGWTLLEDVQSPLLLEDLSACSDYEIQVQPICGGILGVYSNSILFKTDGCCVPPSYIDFEAMTNSIALDWEGISAAIAYELHYREVGTIDWFTVNVLSNNYIISDLAACQEYEFQVKIICSTLQSFYSDIYTHTTLGCGACLENTYCESYGLTGSLSWIDTVSVANLNHASGGSANGYSDFTDQSASLIQGFVHEIDISTDFNFIQQPSLFSVWVDLNQNGVFETTERLLHSSSPEVATSGLIYIPQSTLLGSTRMRVSFMEADYGPCGSSNNVGEVEDYCVYIAEPIECLPPVNYDFEVSYNSVDMTWSGNVLADEYLLQYREVGTLAWNTETTINTYFTLNNLSACTDYEYFLTSICDGETSAPSPVIAFTTKGCGTCLDEAYCPTSNINTNFEWIERVTFNDFENLSGSNGGYMHFQDYTTNLFLGENYSLEIEPGFANEQYLETFAVWIDFNQDGFFDNWSEKVLDEVSLDGTVVAGVVAIPTDAVTGSTRMRVSMKYGDFILEPCENNFFGEIEEYCINIYASQSDACVMTEVAYHESLDSFSVAINWWPTSDADAYKLRYRLSQDTSGSWCYVTTASESLILDQLIYCENYDVQLQTICDSGLSNFGETYIFNTCNNLVAAEEVSSADHINLFPNPFSKRTNLTIKTDRPEVVSVEAFNNLGQRIKLFQFEAKEGDNTFELDFDNTQPGVYFLNIYKNGEGVLSRKVVMF